jgi:hypothetical protein
MRGTEAAVDTGYGVNVSWDTPVLNGYLWTHFPNRAWLTGSDHFLGLINPVFGP